MNKRVKRNRVMTMLQITMMATTTTMMIMVVVVR